MIYVVLYQNIIELTEGLFFMLYKYPHYVATFTQAVMATKNESVSALDDAAKVFLNDNCLSEVGELVIYKGYRAQVDAIADCMIYASDLYIRLGFLDDWAGAIEGIQFKTADKARELSVGEMVEISHYVQNCCIEFSLYGEKRSIEEIIICCADFLCMMGADPDKVLKIITGANSRKVHADGTVTLNDIGKVLKPEGWYPSDEELDEYISTLSFK